MLYGRKYFVRFSIYYVFILDRVDSPPFNSNRYLPQDKGSFIIIINIFQMKSLMLTPMSDELIDGRVEIELDIIQRYF